MDTKEIMIMKSGDRVVANYTTQGVHEGQSGIIRSVDGSKIQIRGNDFNEDKWYDKEYFYVESN